VSRASCLSDQAALLFVERDLGPDEAAAVKEHIDGCGACRELISETARSFLVSEAPDERRGGMLRVGRYEMRSVLGAGAMGIVYAGYDPELDRPVALKVLLADRGEPDDEGRLQREARAMARLSHPNVVTVYDVGSVGGQVFVAMELVEGRTLTVWLREASRAWPEILEVFVGAGRGLAAAHEAGVVHRDFKPDNVLVGTDGRARVTDFGLARHRAARRPAVDSAADIGLTRSGVFAGTPAYMAPEQFDGGQVEARSDQFGFCVALFEALYGVRPFAGATFAALAEGVRAGHVREPPPDHPVPLHVRRAVMRGLEADPARRWPTMTGLLDELASARDKPRGRRGRAALVVALAVLVVVGGIGASWNARRSAGSARLAEAAALRKSGQTERARAAAEDAERLFARSGDRAGRIDALGLARSVDVAAGDLDAGVSLSGRIVALARENGDARRVVRALADQGEVLVRRGRLRAALGPLDEALTAARRLGDDALTLPILEAVAEARTNLADFDAAAPYYAEAKRLLTAQGRIAEVDQLTSVEGVALLERLDLRAAERTFGGSLESARRVGDARGEGFALAGLGAVHEYRGELAAARGRYEAWLMLSQTTDLGSLCKVALAILAMEDGRPADAEVLARASAAHFAANHTEALRAYADAVLAWSLLEQHRRTEAAAAAEHARIAIADHEVQRMRHTVLSIAALVDATSDDPVRVAAGARTLDTVEAEARATGTWRAVVWTGYSRGRAALERGDPQAGALLDAAARDAEARGLLVVAKLAVDARRRAGP
jgi:tetratricopeptide (TPR) repeat protein